MKFLKKIKCAFFHYKYCRLQDNWRESDYSRFICEKCGEIWTQERK